MERVVTSMDQHGRMLIPSHLRDRFNIQPGEKVTLEIENNQIKILNYDDILDEAHAIFTKYQKVKQKSVVDDFIKMRRDDFLIEQARERKE